MIIATMEGKAAGTWTGDARLYRLEAPIEYGWGEDGGLTLWVVASAVDNPWVGQETMVFPATQEGTCLDWGELGCVRYLSHADALDAAGIMLASGARQ